MLKNDYIFTQIEGLAKAIAKIFFNKESIAYEMQEDTFIDELYERVQKLIGEGKINEAENLLYDNIDSSNLNYLKLVLDFYNTLNTLEEDFLEAHDYGKDEILQGLKDIASQYGMPMN